MNYFRTVIISDQAEADIQNTFDHIREVYGLEKTASNYKAGLYKTINKLSYLVGIRPFNPYVQAMFGANAHHVVFKKMVIIYYIEDDCIYVERVIAGSMIH